MGILNTVRLALRYPNLAEASDLAHLIEILAEDVDTKAVGFYPPGLHAARPAAGVSNMLYWETDSGALFFDDGATWHSVGSIAAGSITSAMILDGTIVDADIAADTLTARVIAANAIGSSELADNSVDAAAIQALAVTFAKLAANAAMSPLNTGSGLKYLVDFGQGSGTEAGSGIVAPVSFAASFAAAPLVYITPVDVAIVWVPSSITAAGFNANGGGAAGLHTFNWLAIGH